MLDLETSNQLSQYLELLESDIVIKLSLDDSKTSRDMETLVSEITALSKKVSVVKVKLERTPSFSINKVDKDFGVVFAGLPLGHEFSSLILALLQVSGRAPKVDEKIIKQIKKIDKKLNFTTYVSLTCHNCPDVVQALNIMSVINPNVTHTMVDGGINTEEVKTKNIMGVPAIYLNGEFFNGGRTSIEEILDKLGLNDTEDINEVFDVLVVGGGPAGVSATVYAARKGIKTGVVTENIGGQILDTANIENLISIKSTTGTLLAANLEDHIKEYNATIFKGQRVKELKKNDLVEVILENGNIIKSKTLVIATGATWRNINVPGEKEYKNKGVAYCPHCDGPLFKGKPIAVVGGGNSGIEAAIDLAGLATHVTVLEFMPELKADKVLQERLRSLPNVTVLTNVQVKEITGSQKVNGVTYIDRSTDLSHHIALEGIFIQIGLAPNTAWLGDFVSKDKFGQIEVDSRGATNVAGVFAAGDCTNGPYKQIIVSMGSGATAALSAFDYLIRN
jgi:alkyl hydroperoxide reductase subunit F